MTLDFDGFQDAYTDAANLDAIVSEIARRVPAQVYTQALEDCRDLPLGPTDPLLDLCDIPFSLRPSLVPVPRANERMSDDVLAALLAANRTQQGAQARNAAKAAILATGQKT